jgi:hypothetical protein
MPADIEDCLTEVRCRSTKGYGTGYLIAPDLVLTALHVVASSLAEPPPTDIEIRTVAHFRKRIDFQEAKLIWPPAERWAELSGIDIALLEVKPDTITQAAARRIRLGSEGLPRNKELQISFAGFPRLMEIEGTVNRDAKQMFGEAAPISGIKQNLIEITIKGRQAESDEGWKGASGAAVFVDEQIVAVLSVKVVAGMVAARLPVQQREPGPDRGLAKKRAGHKGDQTASARRTDGVRLDRIRRLDQPKGAQDRAGIRRRGRAAERRPRTGARIHDRWTGTLHRA